MKGTATTIAALVLRRRAVVRGKVISVVSYQLPWVRTDVELSDGTGAIILRFMGRAELPGFAMGRCMTVEGTPALERAVLLMRNPLYSFGDKG
ncbi:MAG TPA: hypothetical protein VN886_20075 [Acidimicrobiales bacterium]|nr:hypothetical protein [Acidimicrobiales bacterium]